MTEKEKFIIDLKKLLVKMYDVRDIIEKIGVCESYAYMADVDMANAKLVSCRINTEFNIDTIERCAKELQANLRR